ncbi:MAG: hypothetical protein IOC52_03715 [Methylobacterium sp.]|nr:hypothetical protein [Methylobacterium sp.]
MLTIPIPARGSSRIAAPAPKNDGDRPGLPRDIPEAAEPSAESCRELGDSDDLGGLLASIGAGMVFQPGG